MRYRTTRSQSLKKDRRISVAPLTALNNRTFLNHVFTLIIDFTLYHDIIVNLTARRFRNRGVNVSENKKRLTYLI